MKIEYQIVIDTKSGLCESIDSFKSLLNINSKITIQEEGVLYKNKLFPYQIELNKFDDRKQNVFEIAVFLNDEGDIKYYLELLKLIREILNKASLSIMTLWDDLTVQYSSESYPLIHKVENQLRKLITKFMVLNVGLNWIDENLPSNLKADLSKTKKQRTGNSNILHNSDFIQLADFLFKPYSNKPIELMFKTYKKEKDISKISMDDYLPKSNWERYFSKVIGTEDSYFNKRWTRLYELRCVVAHNSFLSFKDFEEIKELTNELGEIIEKALLSLDKVEVPEEEKEELIENAAATSSNYIADFLEKWNEFTEEYYNLIMTSDKVDNPTKIKIGAAVKKKRRILNRYKVPDRKKYNLFLSVRNSIAHQIGANTIGEQKIMKYIREIELVTEKIKNTVPNIKG